MKTKSKTFDNYYLADMKPTLKVLIDIKTNVSANIFRSVLSFCKQWNIKDIILKVYDLNNAKLFDQLYNATSDTFLFSANDFNFYLQYENLETSIINELWKNKENPYEFLLSYLTHNENFEVQFQSFGTDIFRFFDFKPESFKIQPDNNKIKFTLKKPENVFALFYSENQTSKDTNFKTVNLNKYFNRKNGKVVFPWKITQEINIFVIRKIYGYIDNSLNQKLNYFSENVFNIYLKYINKHLDKDSSFFKGVYLQPYKVNSILKNSIPVNSDFVENYSEKKGKDFFRTALNIWHKFDKDSYLQSIEFFNYSREQIQNTFKKAYSNHIKSDDKKLIFEIIETGEAIQKTGIPLYLFDFANKLNDFCVYIDSNNIFPNGIYSRNKEIELRIASSITHHYENKTVNIKCGKLLNTKNSFEDKLWHINWLISCGSINIIQDVMFDYAELNINLYNNLPTYDPSYFAYKNWIHYIQTISHFARKGTHRCDILVLYPTESYLHGNVIELANILPQMANNGIDFDLIDYTGFIDNEICKIKDATLIIKKEKFPILILPGVEIIPSEVLRKINEFYSAGGTVIAIGNLPLKSTNWDEDNEIETISNEIWFKKSTISSTKFKTNKWGGKGYFQSDINLLPDIISENRKLLNFQVISNSGKVRTLIRELPTEYYLLLFNMSETEEFRGKIHSKFKGKPYVWDYEMNESKEFHNFVIKDSFLQFPVTIPAKQSKIFILKKQSLKSLPKITNTNLENITGLKIKNHNITINALIREKGKYETEINLLNVNKKAFKNIQSFLPVLTISSKNWNIEFNNKKIIDKLGDLSRYDHTYHGSITYKKIIVISKEYLNDYKIYLDLGKIKDIVEIHINNNNLGLLLLPPFKIDISNYITTGDNKFEFKVKNNLSNTLSSFETVEQKNFYIKEYGLYGPVKIIPYKEIELTC